MTEIVDFSVKVLTIIGNLVITAIGVVVIAMGIFGGSISVKIEGIKKFWE